MRFLSIDYGEKRVGIAVSDEGGILAFPKEIILNSSNINIVEYISQVIDVEKIDEVVVGESFDHKGVPNKIEGDIADFVEELRQKIKIPIIRQKEFLTSVEARKGVDIKNPRGKVDDSAAALILQRYLDKVNNHNQDGTSKKV
jgi:putative Holliday junction resolvase